MEKFRIPEATLSNGVNIPMLGLGTWKSKEGQEVTDAVKYAIQIGYRHIDTASAYGNEDGVGQAIRESETDRDYLFITTKVWNTDQGYDSTLKAFDQSIKKLGLEYIDLYLIHWPVKGKFIDTWKAIERLYKEGRIKAAGVSNFHTHHIEALLSECEIKPMLNQVECHPLLIQEELRGFCQKHQIQFESWSPLMQGNLNLPYLEELSAKYNKSKAQIVLRWNIDNNLVTIPKSVTSERIRQNAEIFDFKLEKEEILKIYEINTGKRFGPDPDNFKF